MKKFITVLSIVLAILLIFSTLPIMAYATEIDGDYEYTVLDDGTARIDKYNGAGGNIVVPDTLGGHTVSGFAASVFQKNKKITGIVIPDSIGEIVSEAFVDCNYLRKVTIPKSVVKICKSAFFLATLQTVCYEGSEEEWNAILIEDENEFLTESEIFFNGEQPDPVTVYTSGDFQYVVTDNGTAEIVKHKNTNASSVQIPETIDGYTVTSIGDTCFSHRTDLITVTIPETVTRIGKDAFRNCFNLKDVKLPSSLEIIDKSAFINCDSFLLVIIPDSVRVIDIAAFWSCDKMTEVVIPDTVAEIRDYAFYSDYVLQNIYYGGSQEDWNAVAIEKNNSINSHMLKYDSKGYYDSSYIYIGYGDDTAEIKKYIGSDTEIAVPENLGDYSVVTIGNNAFRDRTAITSVTLPNTVTSIGANTFYNCKGLTEISLSDKLTNIGANAFRYCSKLEAIDLPDSLRSIGDYAFNETKLKRIELPKNLKMINNSAFDNCQALESVTLPDGLTTIGSQAFFKCDSFEKQITIPASVTAIGDKAFGYIDVKDVGVTKVDGFTIYGHKDTEAQKYAEKNGFTFVDLDATAYILGDVDDDGEVGVIDATYIQRYNAGFNIPISDEDIFARGDVDGDEEVSVIDATYIQRYDAGFNVPYPIGEAI